jgi:hypothetical protein
MHIIHLIQSLVTTLVQYPPLFPPHYINFDLCSSLNVFESFHLSICNFGLYNHIPTTLWHDVQVAFHFPLNKLAQDPYDMAI